MGTDLHTSESLKGIYGAKPTRKILSTQPTINISKEEMISEHSVGFYSLLSHTWGDWLEQVSTTSTVVAAGRGPCCPPCTLLLRRGLLY